MTGEPLSVVDGYDIAMETYQTHTVYSVERDANGDPVVDAEGNNILIPVLDENGNPTGAYQTEILQPDTLADGAERPDDLLLVAEIQQVASGLDASVWQKGDQLIISFAGTSWQQSADAAGVGGIVLGAYRTENLNAVRDYIELQVSLRAGPNTRVTIIGESQSAPYVQTVMKELNAEGRTQFEAITYRGLGINGLQPGETADNVRSFAMRGDIVPSPGDHYGQLNVLDNSRPVASSPIGSWRRKRTPNWESRK